MNAEHSQTTICPPIDTLAQLASGSLSEQYASRLFSHIETCVSCQDTIDELERRAGGLIDAALKRKDTDHGSVEDLKQLPELIRRAQEEARNIDSSSASKPSNSRVPIGDFVNGFRKCGLLPDHEVEACLEEINSDDSVDSSDSGSLAQALVNRRKLTHFQARVLLRGRWKGLVLGRYAILDSLGQGGMGNVFKAKHQRLGRTVCLKVINSAGRQSSTIIDRFRNEARALAALNHPNIVVAHDADESKGVPFLVMEHIEGSDLSKHVKAHGPLPVDQALQVALQTSRALEYAHRKGVIHRDVKPHNLFLTQHPKTGKTMVKVLDLGLARFDTMMSDDPEASLLTAMTNTGVVIGTVDYMSPEQALDSRTADARSDIYSLGCTLFYLLTGRSPFSGETVIQRLVAHREQVAPAVSDTGIVIPLTLETAIRQMLAKDPDDRYQSMHAVAEDVELILAGQEPVGVGDPTKADSRSGNSPMHRSSNRTPAYKMRSRWESIMPFVAILFAIGILGSCYSLFGDRLLARQGAARAIRNGGNGRALIVVSHDWFEENEFVTLVHKMQNNDIDVVTASPRNGFEKTEFGADLKRNAIRISLDHFDPAGFDALCFMSGKNNDLMHKKPENHEKVKHIVKSSLDQGLVISAVGNGWDVIDDTNLCKDCIMENEGKVKVGVPGTTQAVVMTNHHGGGLDDVANRTFQILAKRKAVADEQAPWWKIY